MKRPDGSLDAAKGIILAVILSALTLLLGGVFAKLAWRVLKFGWELV